MRTCSCIWGTDVRSSLSVDDIEARASMWDARLRSHDCSTQVREQFYAWLAQDARNRLAFDRLQAALVVIREAREHPQLRALRESARVMERRLAGQRTATRWAIAAAVAVMAIGVGFLAYRHVPSSVSQGVDTFAASAVSPKPVEIWAWSTGIRERKTVALPDGSSATLNASTRLESEWLPQERRIHLLAGQVLFRVAKDKRRPFVVTAGNRTVTALGTAFDVRVDADTVQVTLLEGRIAVKGLQTAANQPVLELMPSQQLVAVNGYLPTIRPVNAVAESAWAEGQVLFADDPLPDAVAKMNQYSAKRIVAAPELSQFRVNGMFRAGNQDSFVTAITTYFPLVAHEDSQGNVVLAIRRDVRSRD